MKKLSNIDFWFRSHLYKGVVFENNKPAFREFHVRLYTDIPGINPQNYYFIEGYEGSLQLNQSPLSYDEKELLSEIASSIENALMLHSNELIFSPTYTNQYPTDLSSSSSAAA